MDQKDMLQNWYTYGHRSKRELELVCKMSADEIGALIQNEHPNKTWVDANVALQRSPPLSKYRGWIILYSKFGDGLVNWFLRNERKCDNLTFEKMIQHLEVFLNYINVPDVLDRQALTNIKKIMTQEDRHLARRYCEHFSEQMENSLMYLIRNMIPCEKPFVVYRGMKSHHDKLIDPVNNIYESSSFISTTSNYSVATRFGPIIWKMIVPAGARCLPIREEFDEHEFLFAKGTQYKLIAPSTKYSDIASETAFAIVEMYHDRVVKEEPNAFVPVASRQILQLLAAKRENDVDQMYEILQDPSLYLEDDEAEIVLDFIFLRNHVQLADAMVDRINNPIVFYEGFVRFLCDYGGQSFNTWLRWLYTKLSHYNPSIDDIITLVRIVLGMSWNSSIEAFIVGLLPDSFWNNVNNPREIAIMLPCLLKSYHQHLRTSDESETGKIPFIEIHQFENLNLTSSMNKEFIHVYTQSIYNCEKVSFDSLMFRKIVARDDYYELIRESLKRMDDGDIIGIVDDAERHPKDISKKTATWKLCLDKRDEALDKMERRRRSSSPVYDPSSPMYSPTSPVYDPPSPTEKPTQQYPWDMLSSDDDMNVD
eukprot:GILJ01012749.1.p1 GENE.GILJ01012749.1~~GILJ01012749.1.p1  ORF type:complete len:627 (+),score=69.00 GILJ01012749.1:101-1882(+)